MKIQEVRIRPCMNGYLVGVDYGDRYSGDTDSYVANSWAEAMARATEFEIPLLSSVNGTETQEFEKPETGNTVVQGMSF